MKITNVKMSILEMDGEDRYFDLIKLQGQRRERWLHHTVAARSKPRYEYVLHVETDEGVVGVCTTPGDGHTGLHPVDLPQLQALVVGEDPLKREYLYQKLHQGTRWVYRSPSWFGGFDNCLWDIAGKVAGLPVYSLLGKVRDEVHAYYNTRGATIEEAVEDAQRALDLGFVAVKDHFYHPVEENIRWLTAISSGGRGMRSIACTIRCDLNFRRR